MHKLSHAQLAALVKRVQSGDADAFATLYAATIESQLYFATAFLKDSMLAEDVVQEVYLSLYKNINNLETPQLFVAYLNRICYNACVSFKRKQSRRQTELNEDVLANQRDQTPENSPDERYQMLEDSSSLQKALASLPDHLRATFLYRNYHEMRIREIAAVMDCSDSTVKRNLKAAVKMLKEQLARADYEMTGKESDYA